MCVLVLCFVIGYVLVLLWFGYVLHFGEIAHKTVHIIIIICAAKIECNIVGSSVHLLGIFYDYLLQVSD